MHHFHPSVHGAHLVQYRVLLLLVQLLRRKLYQFLWLPVCICLPRLFSSFNFLFNNQIRVFREMFQNHDWICGGWICDHNTFFCCFFSYKVFVVCQLPVMDQCRRFDFPFSECSVTFQTDQTIWCTVFDRDGLSRKNCQPFCTDCFALIADPLFNVSICDHVFHRSHRLRCP